MDQRGQAVVRRIDLISKLAQCAEQRSLRTLVHARNSMEAIDAFAEADECAEEAGSGAGVPDE